MSASGLEPKICQREDVYLHLYEADRKLLAIPIEQAGALPLSSVGAGSGPCAGSWLCSPALPEL